jgi:uncharacterized repeat protein (TIGR03943 family)
MIALIEIAILSGTATLLLARWLRGQLNYYIHPRYSLLIVAAALLLLLLALVQLRVLIDGSRGRPSWGYLLLATPLLLGTLIPARPLGADTLAGRGVELNRTLDGSRVPQLTNDTRRWTLLDWGSALSVQGEALRGEPVDIIGFVFHDQTLGRDAFYAVRYVVTCCAADGAGVGLPVVWNSGAMLPEDSWVRVTGSIDWVPLAGVEQLVIRADRVEPIAEPDDPYLYP